MTNISPPTLRNSNSAKRALGIGGVMLALAAALFWRGLAPVDEAARVWSLGAHRGQVNWLGYVDAAGRWVVRPRYPEAREFSDGLALVRGPLPEFGSAFIDKHGRVVCDRVRLRDGSVADGKSWRGVSDFHEGIAALQWGGALVFFNAEGRELFSMEGAAAPVTPGDSASLSIRFCDGLAIVTKGGRAGAIDGAGHWAVKPDYELIEPFQGGLALAKRDGQWLVIDKQGKVVAAFEAKAVWRLSRERFLARRDGLQGVTDTRGRWALPLAKRSLIPLEGGRCALYDLDSNSVLDADGKPLFSTDWRPEGRYSEGLCAVADAKGLAAKGYMDEEGKVVFRTAKAMTYLGPFIHGLAEVGYLKGDAAMTYLIDRQGRVVAADENGKR